MRLLRTFGLAAALALSSLPSYAGDGSAKDCTLNHCGSLTEPSMPNFTGKVTVHVAFVVDLSETIYGPFKEGSGSTDEFTLMMQGHAQALKHPTVLNAVNTGPVAFTIVYFGNDAHHAVTEIVFTKAQMASFAERHFYNDETGVAAPRLDVGPNTSIAAGLLKVLKVLDQRPFSAARTVLDVIGDGQNNHFSAPSKQASSASDQAGCNLVRSISAEIEQKYGADINGLPILGENSPIKLGERGYVSLDDYYEHCVISSKGFVEVANGVHDLVEALRIKLIQEMFNMVYAEPQAYVGDIVEAHLAQ